MSDDRLTKEQAAAVASKLFKNGLGGGAEMWLPGLKQLNELRAELGLEPLTRDQVGPNIHLMDEPCSDD